MRSVLKFDVAVSSKRLLATSLGLCISFIGLAEPAGHSEHDSSLVSATGQAAEVDNSFHDSGYTDLVLPMRVNGRLIGDKTSFFMIDYGDGKIAVDPDAWRVIALKFIPGENHIINYGGVEYVKLDAIYNVEYEVDALSQVLKVNFPLEFHTNQKVWNSYRPTLPDLTSDSLSGWLNYDVTGIYSSGNDIGLGGVFHTALAWRNMALEYSHVLNSNLSTNRDVRIATRFSADFPERGSRLTIGDTMTTSVGGSIYRGSFHYGGIRWSSTGQTDPRYVRRPVTAIKGVAQEPSVITVYEDNIPRMGFQVEPGPYSLDVPASIAANGDARFVVRDILGREQVVEIPFFYNGDVVAQGTYSYSYEFGRAREDLGFENAEYGDWFVASSHSYGISDNLTMTGEGQLSKGLSSVAARANTSSHFLKSSFSAAVGWSEARGYGDGGLATATWRTSLLDPVRLNFFGRYADRDFLRTGTESPLPKLDVRAGLGTQVPWLKGSLDIIYTHSQRWDAEARKRVFATHNFRIGRSNFGLQYSANAETLNDYSLYATFSRSFGEHNFNIGQVVEPEPRSTSYSIARGVTRERIGHQLTYVTDYENNHDVAATVTALSDVGLGRAAAYFDVSEGSESSALTLGYAGGMGFAGANFVASRALQGGFAIVEAEGASHVQVQAAGDSTYTNSEGVAIVSGLKPYVENDVRLADRTSLDIFGNSEAKKVVPSRLGGVYVNLSASRGSAATVTFVDINDQPIPSGAKVSYEGDSGDVYVSDLGYAFLTKLSADNNITIRYGGRSWRAVLTFTPSQDPLPDLGKVICYENVH